MYWLMKSEPSTYSFTDLKKDKTTLWEGVRNFQARNFIKEMQKDDLVLFYHSNSEDKGVVGVAKVIKEAYPDPSAQNPKSKYYDPRTKDKKDLWVVVDIAWHQDLKKLVSLENIKATESLQEMRLVRKGNRLSVLPVTENEFKIILSMGMK